MRPRYHYTPRRNWLSDPNGLVHDGRNWHMFYQYNPYGEDWGHMSWGHAISPDLAHWREMEPALLCDTREMIFSGSAVIDRTDTAGCGRDAMIALYTASTRDEPVRQAQSLAWSNDNGQSWTRLATNPVLDLGLADFRDPYVFRHETTGGWIMVVARSAEQVAAIYRSDNLRDWVLASAIDGGGAPGRIWECPTLVELPIGRTGRTKWLFKVDALHDGPGSGSLCCIGDFDGYRFTAETGWDVIDHGRDFYAAIAWNGPLDSAGRPAWIGWMGNHAYQARFPEKGWRGVMSLPRRLELVQRDGALRLAQSIEPSILRRFGPPSAPDSANTVLPGHCRIDLGAGFSGELMLQDDAGSRFTVHGEGDRWHFLREDRRLSFLRCETGMDRDPDGGLSLWIDSETIEAITTDGTGSASFQHRPAGQCMALATDCAQAVSIFPLR